MSRSIRPLGFSAFLALLTLILAQSFAISVSADTNETAVAGPNALSQSSVTAGGRHTCALLTSGSVRCWGFNEEGQLGDSTPTGKPTPTPVYGLTSGVTAITAGGAHTCALLSNGSVQCWGFNGLGQLGDNPLTTPTNKLTPTPVYGLTSGVAAITAGGAHTCALLSNGSVQCWGFNSFGQLGDDSTDSKFRPTPVYGLTSGVAAITAGNEHTCALLVNGPVQCWGSNAQGQLGDNSTDSKFRPTPVYGLTSGVAAITAGNEHTCALLTTGAVKCWGSSDFGQLGDSTSTGKPTPTPVDGLTSGVTAITAGGAHTCALLSNGSVQCWGFNGNGSLGDDSLNNKLIPTQVNGLTSGVTAITGGNDHTCALLTTASVQCWGSNDVGQLGDDTLTNKLTPTQVNGLTSGVGLTTSTTSTTTTTTTTLAPATTTVAPTAVATKPVLTRGKKVTARQISSYLKMKNTSKSKIVVKVAASSRKVCSYKSGAIRATKKGKCTVVVSGRSLSGKKVTRTLTFTIKK